MAGFAACGGGEKGTGPNPPPSAAVAAVTVTPDSSDVAVNATAQLSATLKDATGHTLSGRLTTWSSSDPTVATVSGGGLVTAVLPGRATITATAEGKSGSAVVRSRAPADSLPGATAAPAVSAFPALTIAMRPGDYATNAPDLPGLALSFNTVLVMIAPDATIGQVNALLREFEATIVGGIPGVAAQTVGLVALRLPTKNHTEMAAQLALLRARSIVRGVVRDKILEPLVLPGSARAPFGWSWLDTPDVDYTWGMQKIHAPQLWNLNDAVAKTRRKTVTAVLDNGFAATHEDLTYLTNLTPSIVADHGTHVAGIIGATFNNGKGVDGVNPFASLVVKGDAGFGAWLWSFDELMRTSSGIRVLNISLGYNWGVLGRDTNNDAAARQEASDDGDFIKNSLVMVSTFASLPFIVAGSGNDSNKGFGLQLARHASPWANAAIAKGVAPIIVVESDSLVSATGAVTRSGFSNTGGTISAPGSQILSTEPPNAYIVQSGTSQATPHVTGLIGYLLALDPTIPAPTMSTNVLTQFLRGNGRPVTGGAAPMIDAYLSAMDVDALQGGTHVLHALLDIDDGTADGNQRVDRDGLELFSLDLDNDGGLGDGAIDMSDFRRWRDWLLDAEAPTALDLNGQPSNLKRDGNSDGLVNDPNAPEARYSRGDFNGDGTISRTQKSVVPGAMNGRNVTDLEMLQELFSDPNYAVSALPTLLESGDLSIDVRPCLSVAGVRRVRLAMLTGPNDPLPAQERTVNGLDSIEVFTLPVPDPGYLVRAEALDAGGQVISSEESSPIGLGLGGDELFRAKCSESVAVTTLSLPNGAVGAAYFFTLSASGGNGSYTWTLASGQLPPGVALGGTGVLSGIPTTAGLFSFELRVRSGTETATRIFLLLVDADPWIGSFAGTIDYNRPIDNHANITGSIVRNTNPQIPPYSFIFRDAGSTRWECYFTVSGNIATPLGTCLGNGAPFFTGPLHILSGSITRDAVTLSLRVSLSAPSSFDFVINLHRVPNP